MTNAIEITSLQNTTIEDILASGKTAWCIVSQNNTLQTIAVSREVARQAKGKTDKLGKSTEFTFKVLEDEFKKATEAEHKAHRVEVTHESTVERPCKMVWAIADEMKGQKRGKVLAACVDAGIAYYTARTQYQQWLGIQKEMAERIAKQEAKNK